jgi:hypothetical protein
MTDPLDPGLYRDLLSELKGLRGEVAELRRTLIAQASPSMTLDEAAAYLRCDKKIIHRYLRAKKLVRAPKHGKHATVTRTSVEALARPIGAKPPPVAQERALTPLRPFNAEEELARFEAARVKSPKKNLG